MEGTDGTEDGAPGPLTIRRYQRFSQAGPGLIWFEAVATVPEGRASAHQLYLTEKNVDAFRRLTDQIPGNFPAGERLRAPDYYAGHQQRPVCQAHRHPRAPDRLPLSAPGGPARARHPRAHR